VSAHAYRRLLVLVVVLGILVGLWILPRGLSFGSTVPTEPIELQLAPETPRPVTSEPASRASVDDGDLNDDDGDDRDGAAGRDDDDDDDDRRRSRRADLRGQRADEPAAAADDDDDDDDDDGDDDDDDDDEADDDD
jgi:hypothetical protein